MKSFSEEWEKIHSTQEWGRYPSETVIRFIARNYYKTEREKDLWFPLRSVQAESLHLVSILPQRPVLLKGLHVSSAPGTARGWLRQFEKNRVIGDHCLAKDRTTWWSKAKNFVPFGGRNALLRTRGRPGRNRNKQEQNKTFVPNSDFLQRPM